MYEVIPFQEQYSCILIWLCVREFKTLLKFSFVFEVYTSYNNIVWKLFSWKCRNIFEHTTSLCSCWHPIKYHLIAFIYFYMKIRFIHFNLLVQCCRERKQTASKRESVLNHKSLDNQLYRWHWDSGWEIWKTIFHAWRIYILYLLVFSYIKNENFMLYIFKIVVVWNIAKLMVKRNIVRNYFNLSPNFGFKWNILKTSFL